MDPNPSLISLEELVEQLYQAGSEQIIANIKFTTLSYLSNSDSNQVHKDRRQFKRLKELGIMDFNRLTDHSLLHIAGQQKSKLVGVELLDDRCHFLHLTSTENNIEQSISRLSDNAQQPISYWMGICMFGSGVDQAVLSDGSKYPVTSTGGLMSFIQDRVVKEISVQKQVSLYEMLKIKQFSTLISNLIHSTSRDTGVIYLLTPEEQYALYLMPSYFAGKISSRNYLIWREEAIIRAKALYAMFEKRVSVPVVLLSSPLAPAIDYINSEIEAERFPSFDKALDLLSQSDIYWKIVLDDPASRPDNWHELIMRSYVQAAIDAAVSAEKNGHALLCVDDIQEKLVLNFYGKVRRQMKWKNIVLPDILGLYCAPGVVSLDTEKNSFLYTFDQMTMKDYRSIMKAYR
jgi:hypothetical protein